MFQHYKLAVYENQNLQRYNGHETVFLKYYSISSADYKFCFNSFNGVNIN